MLRPLLTTSFIALAAPLWAETFTAPADVDAVTIYPGLAEVTRLVTLDIPAGRHAVIVPDLPEGLSPEGLRVSVVGDAQLGAVNLAYDRLPVTPDMETPEVAAARALVEEIEERLRESADAIAVIRLQVAAADEQIAFLQSLAQARTEGALTAASIADIQALSQMLGAEVLAVRADRLAAEQEAAAAERARQDDIDALADAKQALKALTDPQDQGSVLDFTLTAATAGQVTVAISTLEGFANWQPVYDMRLTTGDAPTLDLDRAVVIGQATGQDWDNVTLTLSTARPGGQTGPGGVWAQLRRIVSEEELAKLAMPQARVESLEASGFATADAVMEEAMAVSPPAPVTAVADTSGAVVTYVYPERVTIRDGVEDLRLPLDRLTFDAEVWAEAVPMSDMTAFRMARFVNDTDEVLLPGQAMLVADGAMLGFGYLPLLAAGAENETGFGPLDGMLLTRMVPNRSQGDRGVFATTNQLTEQSVITIENLTGQNWDVLLRDAIPYSEQDDLEVTYTANPAVTTRDPEGQRGILEWELEVAAGEERTVTLDYTLSWPSGYVLQ